MKAVIVCVSVSHGNTRRIAEAIGEVLDAQVVDPADIDPADLASYDLVGFGSGIFTMNFHPRLREWIRALPPQDRRRAFVFATSGMVEPPFPRYTRSLTALLEQRGYDVVDLFTCRGFDTWWPLRIIGGLSKGHPDTRDIQAARSFAEGLRARLTASS
ncbi:flavodoxin family protein [Nocardia veterana]|uniref:Flavodoxin n=1 Tax=Nocardia veterana TaxID=132249 RepID=A0A7X6LWI5_9NOCA|nr:flavodoxin family protein [Nocardia veterana]NKY85225.1 flavodoxin [Nocardia veterana]